MKKTELDLYRYTIKQLVDRIGIFSTADFVAGVAGAIKGQEMPTRHLTDREYLKWINLLTSMELEHGCVTSLGPLNNRSWRAA